MMKTFDKPNETHQKIEKHFWEIFNNSLTGGYLIPKEILKITYNQLSDNDEKLPEEFCISINTIEGITDKSTKMLLDELDTQVDRSEIFKEVDLQVSRWLLIIGIKEVK